MYVCMSVAYIRENGDGTPYIGLRLKDGLMHVIIIVLKIVNIGRILIFKYSSSTHCQLEQMGKRKALVHKSTMYLQGYNSGSLL